MKKKLILSVILLSLFLLPSCTAEEPLMEEMTLEDVHTYTITSRNRLSDYRSETLRYSIDTAWVNKTKCYLTTVWMADPARQIVKATSPWHERIDHAVDIAKQLPEAALLINGSGYVSPIYPEIPANYPGTSADYYYEPLGSLTITNGEIFRNLEGVPYYGLTLEADGLHMYVGVDNEEVLSHAPTQTWSFYEGCPLARNGYAILDETWPFARVKAIRTIIAKLKAENTYLIVTATATRGLTLIEATDFILGEYDTEWVYDLDGGPSTALIRRLKGLKNQKLIYGDKQKIVDVMGFIE